MGRGVLCWALGLAAKSRVWHLDCSMEISPSSSLHVYDFFQVHNLFSSLDLGE